MTSARSRVVLFVVAGVVAAGGALAQVGSRVPDWPVPEATGLSRMTDAAPPRAFIGVVPCRIVDTGARRVLTGPRRSPRARREPST